MRREIWRHNDSGHFYIVEVESTSVEAAGGPFRRSELAPMLRQGFVSDPVLVERLRQSYSGFRRLDWYERMLAEA